MSEVVIYALLFADKVIIEHQTNKKSAVGMFTEINSTTFPSQIPPWHILCMVGNLSAGAHQFGINISHDGSTSVIWSSGGEFELPKFGMNVELAMEVVTQFPRPGRYTVSVHIDGSATPVLARGINVNKVEERK